MLELAGQGLTQYEIVADFKKMGISVSQKTISNDLAWHRRDAVEFVRKNRDHIAYEYRQVMSNFYQLRKMAWNHFNSTGNETIRTSLYGVIESINNNIMSILAAGDMIELELLEKSKQRVEETRKELLSKTLGQSSEAVF